MTHRCDDPVFVDVGLDDGRGINSRLLVRHSQDLMTGLMKAFDVRQHVLGSELHVAILILPVLKRYVDLSDLLKVFLRNFGLFGNHAGQYQLTPLRLLPRLRISGHSQPHSFERASP